jgi:hypothetical protein
LDVSGYVLKAGNWNAYCETLGFSDVSKTMFPALIEPLLFLKTNKGVHGKCCSLPRKVSLKAVMKPVLCY